MLRFELLLQSCKCRYESLRRSRLENMWNIEKNEFDAMIKHCVEGFPLEACGLFLGPIVENGMPSGMISKVWPTRNAEESARIYSVDSKDMFEASKWANENDLEIVGVFHSHTHSEAYPSATDIAQAVDNNWLYTIVSLAQEEIVANSFQIIDKKVQELFLDVIA